jgi:hypothetical protein
MAVAFLRVGHGVMFFGVIRPVFATVWHFKTLNSLEQYLRIRLFLRTKQQREYQMINAV